MPKGVTRRDIVNAFWMQARPYKWRLLFVVVFMVVAYFAEALAPWAGKQLVDHLVSVDARSWATIRPAFIFVIALTFCGWLFRRIADRVSSTFRSEVSDRGARDFGFKTIMGRPFAYFLDTPAGTAIRSVEKYSQAIGETFEQVVYNLLNPVLLACVILVSLTIRSWLLGLGFAVWTTGFVLMQWYLSKKQEKMRAIVREADAIASGRLADVIGNASAVKTFAAEAREESGVDRVLGILVKKEREAWMQEENYWAVQSFFFVVLEFALVGYVLDGWTHGTFTVGDFVLVQGSATLLFSPLVSLGSVFRRLPRMFSYASDIVELSKTPSDVQDIPNAKKLHVERGEIQFDRVVFGYKDGPSILKDFSLVIKPGEKIAFVGPSGAGKSTIVKLLYRFYDPRRGTVSLDGQNIAEVTQESLRSTLSLVPQDPALFHRSVLDNIRYARPSATEKEVIVAAKRAHCHEFVLRLPDGYKTLVGERGVKLSGGERQRVAIARAILADSPILVMDEATSSLDSESESLIQDALHELMADKTVLVIAHRLSTIMEMDRIIVVENGRVTAQGTHEQLLKRAGTYRRLWNLQSGGYIKE